MLRQGREVWGGKEGLGHNLAKAGTLDKLLTEFTTTPNQSEMPTVARENIWPQAVGLDVHKYLY